MPRIRTLKPEHKTHRKVGRLTDRAYRLWVGLVTEADDAGRLVGDTAQLRAVVFGLRPETTIEMVSAALGEILKVGLAVRYGANGTRYLVLPSYADHQRINRPSPSKLPPPPGNSRSTHGALTEKSAKLREPSVSTHAGSDQGSRKGSPTYPRGKTHRATPVPRGISDDLSITRTDRPEPVAAVLGRMGFIQPAEGGTA